MSSLTSVADSDEESHQVVATLWNDLSAISKLLPIIRIGTVKHAYSGGFWEKLKWLLHVHTLLYSSSNVCEGWHRKVTTIDRLHCIHTYIHVYVYRAGQDTWYQCLCAL